jgi:hypothetical protein
MTVRSNVIRSTPLGDLRLTVTTAGSTDNRLREKVGQALDEVAAEANFLLTTCGFPSFPAAAAGIGRYVGRRLIHSELGISEITSSIDSLHEPTVTSTHCSSVKDRYQIEHKYFGQVDIIQECSQYGIYLLHIMAGGAILSHKHMEMDEMEMVLSDGLLVQGRHVSRHTSFSWPRGFPHRYDNPTVDVQTVLCVDRPRFIPLDEIETGDPVSELRFPPHSMFYPPATDRGA